MEISEFINTINSTDSKFKIDKKPGIDINELRKIEKKLDIKLPNDLVDFYTFSNGLEGDNWIFNIIPLNEVEKGIDDLGEYLIFSEYMIYSETCGLEIDSQDNNKYKFFNWTTDKNYKGKTKRSYKAESIIGFIELYCAKGTFGIFIDDETNTDNDNVDRYNYKLPDSKKPWWKLW